MNIVPINHLQGSNLTPLADTHDLTKAFFSQGLDVFLVSPNESPRVGTVFFNDLASAKSFVCSPLPFQGYQLRANTSAVNEWYKNSKVDSKALLKH